MIYTFILEKAIQAKQPTLKVKQFDNSGFDELFMQKWKLVDVLRSNFCP